MWAAQIDALEAAGHRVLAPDLPGFGDAALEPPTVDYVAFARRPARRGCSRRRLLVRRPRRARARRREARARDASSCSSRPGSARPSGRRRRRPASPRRRRSLERGDLAGAGEQQARMWLAPDASAEVRELTAAMTVRSYDQQLPFEDEVRAAWPEPSAETRLAELDVPTLLVVGDADLPELRSLAERLARRAARRPPRDDRGRRPSAEPRTAGRAQPATARLPPVARPRAAATRRRPTRRTRRRRPPRATSRRSGSIQRNVAVPGFEPKWP